VLTHAQLCLGSLTNLAGALEADPVLVHRKLKNVVVMGGATRVSPAAWHDHAFYTQVPHALYTQVPHALYTQVPHALYTQVPRGASYLS
jgi:hypothetical protein